MRLFREVLIESAEQAETLPDGTIATSPEDYPAEKHQGAWANDSQPFTHQQMVGFTALVPVEVAEGPGGHGRSWYIFAPEFD